MVAATWGVFAVLALLWTGGAAMGAALAGWTAEAIATGTAGAAAREIAALPVPQWIAVWADPAWIQAMQAALLWTVEAGRNLLPMVGTAAGWLVPAVWIAWGFGMALLLTLAIVAHLLLRRFARPPQTR
jgi:hypothetical protein